MSKDVFDPQARLGIRRYVVERRMDARDPWSFHSDHRSLRKACRVARTRHGYGCFDYRVIDTKG